MNTVNIEALEGRLKARSNTELVEIHNSVAQKPVAKFSDKTMAVRRTALALEMAAKDYDGTQIIDISQLAPSEPSSTVVTDAPTAAPETAKAPKANAKKLEKVVAAAKVAKERRKVNQLGPMKFPDNVGIERQVRKQQNVKGRTWEVVTVTMPDGSKLQGTTETKNGVNFYFTYQNVLCWAKKAHFPTFDLSGAKAS